MSTAIPTPPPTIAPSDAQRPVPPAVTCEMPEMVLPEGVSVRLPMAAEVTAWQAGGSYVLRPDLSKATPLASTVVESYTTSAGYGGADCQPTWGRDRAIYPVDVSRPYGEPQPVAYLAPVDDVPGLAASGRLWLALVDKEWTQDEVSGMRGSIRRIAMVPAAEFCAASGDDVLARLTEEERTRRRDYIRSIERREARGDEADDGEVGRTLAALDGPRLEARLNRSALAKIRTLCHEAGVMEVEPPRYPVGITALSGTAGEMVAKQVATRAENLEVALRSISDPGPLTGDEATRARTIAKAALAEKQ